MEHLDERAAACNYTGYFEKYVTYPPTGLLPLPGRSVEAALGCDLWDEIFDAALVVNPAFDIYRIFDTVGVNSENLSAVISIYSHFLTSKYPILWDVLGFPYVYVEI